MERQIYQKFVIVTICGIIASIISIVANWPSGKSSSTIVIFIITGLLPLFTLLGSFLYTKNSLVIGEKNNNMFVLATWFNLIAGLTLLVVAAAPKLATSVLQANLNPIAGVIYIIGAYVGFSTAITQKIDMVP